MKTQTLYKRLSLPVLLIVISATGIGVTPARSASLLSSQSTIIAEKRENLNIQQNYGKPPCGNGLRPPDCWWDSPDGVGEPLEERPSSGDNPSNVKIEPPTKPVIRHPAKPVCASPKLVPPRCVPNSSHSPASIEDNPHNSPQQQQEQLSPTAEPSPQN